MTQRPPMTKSAGGSSLAMAKPKKAGMRVVFYAGEKFGKTSFGAHAPDCVLLQARDETGYQTLLNFGLVPAVRTAVIASWTSLLDTVRELASTGFAGTLVLDSMTAFERLCQEHVCTRDYKGNWSAKNKGFASYFEGYRVSSGEWMQLLQACDKLIETGATVVLLGHASAVKLSPPDTASYERWEPTCYRETWSNTAKWADAILFGQFWARVEEDEKSGKGKAKDGVVRVVRTTGQGAYVAGGRAKMPGDVYLKGDHTQMWDEVMGQIGGRQ